MNYVHTAWCYEVSLRKCNKHSQDSSVSVVTRLPVGNIQFMSGAGDLSLLQIIQTGCGAHLATGCDLNCTSAPPTSLNGAHRDNLTLECNQKDWFYTLCINFLPTVHL